MKEHYPFKNAELPYAYNALEPYIDTKTMELHHDRHLQAYIDNLNKALEGYPYLQNRTLEQLITGSMQLPRSIREPVRHNAGGVYNHRFYFDGLSPSDRRRPIGALSDAINTGFGSFDTFMKQFTEAALSVFGSGYAWLVTDHFGRLSILTTPNQDTPLTRHLCPILNIDVWEHAYYLKHYNKRGDYIADWFNVVNWPRAEELYKDCVRRPRFNN